MCTWIIGFNLDIASHLSDEIAQVHVVGGGLDNAPDNLNQVLKDQGGQVDLVVSLEMVHEPIVSMAHVVCFNPVGQKK